MATITRTKLKRLYEDLAPGSPLTAAALANRGISADLAVHYARSGWLKRLARGVYCRPGQPLSRDSSLLTLQGQIKGLHVGGKTALDWYGVRHYVASQETLHLYGWAAAQLPEWFARRFPGQYHRKRLFRESPDDMLQVEPFERRKDGPLTSAPERALLELLSEVGVRQPLQEARDIMESAHNMRADALEQLLQHCTSVKTVRLCLRLARDLQLSWVAKLDVEKLPTGSDRRWVSKSRDGLLVLKP
ncbi:MAG TPA: type IV toxin-antitoxin system AbiEi family antitoxin domain-containing protein [Candidatus Acidoferrum sp.]|nr:type IV toxin-antitoxin system AbiEi family antitoxin domain-containing protein [Candidatus Acidoferrum sp.]